MSSLKAPRRSFTQKELKDELAVISDAYGSISEIEARSTFDAFMRKNALFVKALIVTEFHAKPQELTLEEKVMISPGRKSQWQHIVWCCDRLLQYADDARYDKAHRWLGFVQGYAWFSGCATIHQLIDSAWDYPMMRADQQNLDKAISYAVNELNIVAAAVKPPLVMAELPELDKKTIGLSRYKRISHVIWCASQAFLMAEKNPLKANQWLGFVQGCLWCMGAVSITQLAQSYGQASADAPNHDTPDELKPNDED